MAATQWFGARGGDNITIVVNDLNLSQTHSCRFVRLRDFNDASDPAGLGAAAAMQVVARVVDYRTLACTTPAWGTAFPGTDTRVVLLSEGAAGAAGYLPVAPDSSTGLHARVSQERFNISFFEVWEGYDLTSAGAIGSRLAFGARGGDEVTLRAFGLDPEANYSVAFRDGATGRQLTVSAVVDRRSAFTGSALLAVTPPWGLKLVASLVQITVFHSPTSAAAIAEAVGASAAATVATDAAGNLSNAVFVYRTRDNIDGEVNLFEVHNGVTSSAQGGLLNGTSVVGGPASGNTSLAIAAFGLDPTAFYACRFIDQANVRCNPCDCGAFALLLLPYSSLRSVRPAAVGRTHHRQRASSIRSRRAPSPSQTLTVWCRPGATLSPRPHVTFTC